MAQTSTEQIESSLGTREYFDNPYPLYHRMRSEAPVYWSEKLNAWLLTRYDDCTAALRDYRRLSNRDRMTVLLKPLGEESGKKFELVRQHFTQGLIFADPPDHTRLRTLVNKAFSPPALERMREGIHKTVDSLIDAMQDKGQMDLIEDFAFPLPDYVRSEMLGLPIEDTIQLKAWSDDIVALFGAGANAERAERGQTSLIAVREYLGRLIATKRNKPGEDLLTTLILAREQNDKLTEGELLSTCSTLFTASQETTTTLIGNGMLALLRNPGELQRLKEDPSLAATAVEEMLRYDGPLQRQLRAATEDFEIRGHQIRKEQMVCPMLGAANRDPEHFHDPDRLDLSREDNRHIAFGFGIHACVGAPLARIEGQIAFKTLLRRLHSFELLDNSIARPEDFTVRSLKSLRVAFKA